MKKIFNYLKNKTRKFKKKNQEIKIKKKDKSYYKNDIKLYIKTKKKAELHLQEVIDHFSQKYPKCKGKRFYEEVMLYLKITDKNFNLQGARYLFVGVVSGVLVTFVNDIPLKINFSFIDNSMSFLEKTIVVILTLITLIGIILFILWLLIKLVFYVDRKIRLNYHKNTIMIDLLQDKISELDKDNIKNPSS